jgi:hypothetical protein
LFFALWNKVLAITETKLSATGFVFLFSADIAPQRIAKWVILLAISLLVTYCDRL